MDCELRELQQEFQGTWRVVVYVCILAQQEYMMPSARLQIYASVTFFPGIMELCGNTELICDALSFLMRGATAFFGLKEVFEGGKVKNLKADSQVFFFQTHKFKARLTPLFKSQQTMTNKAAAVAAAALIDDLDQKRKKIWD